MLKISAIVCTYNRDEYLEKALKSLSNQSLPHENFEVVIINNNSTDKTGQICDKFHREHKSIQYKYIIEKKQGLSFARNRGIEESDANLLTFIDDDAWLDKNFLEVVVHFMEKHPDVSSVGGKILLDYEGKKPKWLSKYLASLFGYFHYSNKTKSFRNSNYPRGSNMTFRKSVFAEVGLFNTELGRIGKGLGGGEEKDIYQRIYQKGKLVYYLPQAIVHHAVPIGRTKFSFIKKQAVGIGISERYRVSDNLGLFMKRILQEITKWGASMILFLFYSLSFQFSKAFMILRFRWWVSQGLFFS